MPTASSLKRRLTSVRIAGTLLPERPSRPTLTIEDREAVVLPSSWVAEASEAEAVVSAVVASEAAALVAVALVVDFSSLLPLRTRGIRLKYFKIKTNKRI